MPLDPGAASAQKKGCFIMFLILLVDACLFTLACIYLHGAALDWTDTILGGLTGGAIGYVMGYRDK